MGIESHSSHPAGKVAVFCTTFLPYSQTFIWDELRSHHRYAADVFAWRRQNAQQFPGEVHLAAPWYPLTRRCARFDRLLASGGFALVHAHFGWAGVIAAPFARRHRLPLVVSFHGLDVALLTRPVLASPLRVWPYTLHAREMLAGMTLGLCASADLLEILAESGVPRERLLEHRLGIDLERFRPGTRDPGKLRVAMVGRFVEKKGFEYGLRAFARFAGGHAHAELEIAGSGPLEAGFRGLCVTLGVQDRVRFLGAIPHTEIAALLARSDVLLAPSVVSADGDRDSGLISAKEASASGCVPIATRHGGIPSIVDDGITGFLVHERDVEAMAARLAMLATNARLRAALADAARAKMTQQYGLAESARHLEDCYDEAVRRHRGQCRGDPTPLW